MKVVVAQRGKHDGFLMPRSLLAAGSLTSLVVDWYPRLSSVLTGMLRRTSWGDVFDGFDAGIPEESIHSLNLWAFQWQRRLRRARLSGHLDTETFLYDCAFAERVAAIRHPRHKVFLGQSCAALEPFQAERKRSARTVLNQYNSGPEVLRIAGEEESRFPGYVRSRTPSKNAYVQRVKHEWSIANGIIVPSDSVREAIVKQGADERRIAVIPPPLNAVPEPSGLADRENMPASPLRVLWMGRVSLTGGIAYLVEAARRLEGKPIEFLVAGGEGIRSRAMQAAPSSVQWLGAQENGSETMLFKRAHVLVMPSLVDGCMQTQLTALSRGVPVIATPACGGIVDDGHTGFTVPARDADALAHAILRFIDEPGLAGSMAAACIDAAGEYSLERHAGMLSRALAKWVGE